MYAKPTTSLKEIKAQIEVLNEELNRNTQLTKEDRLALEAEVAYLESFLPQETW